MEKTYQIALLHTIYRDGSKGWTVAIGPGSFAHTNVKITAKEAKKTIKELELKKDGASLYQGGSITYYR